MRRRGVGRSVRGRLEAGGGALGRELQVCATLSGRELDGLACAHPLSGRRVPLLFGAHVTDTAGTGLVHTAPGHGPEDFAMGQAHGLSAACPVALPALLLPFSATRVSDDCGVSISVCPASLSTASC